MTYLRDVGLMFPRLELEERGDLKTQDGIASGSDTG